MDNIQEIPRSWMYCSKGFCKGTGSHSCPSQWMNGLCATSVGSVQCLWAGRGWTRSANCIHMGLSFTHVPPVALKLVEILDQIHPLLLLTYLNCICLPYTAALTGWPHSSTETQFYVGRPFAAFTTMAKKQYQLTLSQLGILDIARTV